MENIGELQVMVVDDLGGTRAILRAMLERMGFTRIMDAADGRNALALLKERAMHLVISDQNMSDMSGIDLLAEVRKDPALSEIPFIMMSAQAEELLVDNAYFNGAAAFVKKPVSFPSFRTTVFEVLGRAAPES